MNDKDCSQIVGVLIRVKDGNKWKFYPAAYWKGNPLKGTAMVPRRIPTTNNTEATSTPAGRQKLPPILKDANGDTVYENRKFEQFRYHLRLYEDGKMKLIPLDTTNPREVEEARKLKAGKTLAEKAAENVGGEFIDNEQVRLSIADAIKARLAFHKEHNGPITYSQHVHVLALFQESMKNLKRVFMDEVLEEDRKAFEAAASKSRLVAGRANSPCTVHTYLTDIRALFKSANVQFPFGILRQPKKLKTVYDREEQVAPFFDALDKENEENYIIFGMNYFLGMREGEISHAEDTDISFSAKTFRVQMKPHLGWKPKKGKERLIPIPTFFLKRMKKWVEAHADRHLLFIPQHRGSRFKNGSLRPPVRPFTPHTILYRLHRIVRRLGLECGQCENCLNPHPKRYCLAWKTHKFRATNITHKTQSGMDLETAAVEAGHEETETTSEYTAAAVPTQVQDFIDDLDWFKNPYSKRLQAGSRDPAASLLALVEHLESNGYTQEQISQIVSGAGKDLLPKTKGPTLVKAS